ncbi:uncharacterized protein (TIGR02328 family) [Streptococcus rupicaprae]|uniref:Uncharacterized protein (TIGR02328 family) n=1 Tax=Streptococcus rupicaprae TaxID=759619 RepID=A0ABV2FFM3_9STRE
MRLWHQDLMANLPRQQLLGQHRECAALRGRGWGKPHATVNYVFDHSPYKLYQYHVLVMEEMAKRGYQPDQAWHDPNYRGKTAQPYTDLPVLSVTNPIYPEHDETYLQECLDNLRDKGIDLEVLG